MKYKLHQDGQGAWGIMKDIDKEVVPHVYLNHVEAIAELIDHLLRNYQAPAHRKFLGPDENLLTIEQIAEIEKDLHKQFTDKKYII